MLFWIFVCALVAQQVERTAVNRDVGGSSPLPDVFLLYDFRIFIDII